MTELVFKGMKGLEPVLDACLQETGVAAIADNVKLWHGRLDPWRAPRLCKAVVGACAAHIRDCCWRTSDDPCTRFVDILCGPTIISSPTTLPGVINDFCDPDEVICPLGFPCPPQPPCDGEPVAPDCHTVEMRSYMITYGDECIEGAPSPMCDPIACMDKDSPVTITLPSPPPEYCNVTKIRIYRLMATLDVSNSHTHDSREHRNQGDAAPGANGADCFLVGCVDVGTPTFTDSGSVLDAEICNSVISEDWDEPPCGLVIHGMFDSGALVGSIGDTVRFSEFNTHHAWPCKYEMTVDCRIIEICVCGATAFVFTERGIHIIQDTLDALDTFCRPMLEIKRPMPLCHHKGVLCLDNQVIYATMSGLYRMDSTGRINNLAERIGSDNWQQMDPGSMRLGLYEHRLMLTSNRFSGIYDIDVFGTGVPSTGTLSTISICPQCWLNDKQGQLFMLAADGIYQWDAGDEYLDMCWRSEERHYAGFCLVTAAKINFTAPKGVKTPGTEAATMTLFADGCQVAQRQVHHSRPIRLPKCHAESFAVEFRGRRSISSATLAASIRCIGTTQ